MRSRPTVSRTSTSRPPRRRQCWPVSRSPLRRRSRSSSPCGTHTGPTARSRSRTSRIPRARWVKPKRVNLFGFTHRALGILEVLDRERAVGPVWVPQGDDDRLLLLKGLLETGQHCRRRGGLEVEVLETVGRDRLVLGDAGQACTGVDTGDGAVELFLHALEVTDGFDVHVFGDRDVERCLVIPGAEVDDLVLVLLPVVLMRHRQPGVEEQVEIAFGDADEYRCDVKFFEFNLVAFFFEDVLPQVADRDVFIPSGSHPDGDRFVVVTTLVGSV